jgi:RNA polymerase sigma-70 factor (ECF subfamily)
MHTTSVSLLERLRRPDEPDAWARFVWLYTPFLWQWARRAGLREPDAADLVQDVFLVLLRKLPEFHYDPRRSFRAWLRAVALNKWRERCRRPAVPVDAAAAGLLDELPGPGEDAFWEGEYRRYVLRRALQVMQADFRPATWQACWQMVVDGKTAPEVADALGLTVGAVYAAKVRVLARLREELAGLTD